MSTASASSIFLASAASVVSTSSPQLFLYMYVFFWVALAHAICHDDLSPTETHGSIIAVLTMMLHALVCGAVLVRKNQENFGWYAKAQGVARLLL